MTSLALNLSIFFVVLASICFSAPIVDYTTMESELFDTTELVPRALKETNEITSSSTTTTIGKGEEEMNTISTETSSKSSHDKESEGDESRETREFSEMNTSESPMDVTEQSTSYSDKDAHYDRTSTTVQPRRETETQRVPVAPSAYEMKKTDGQIPRESSTTMRMMSTSTSSSSSSRAPGKYVGRLEDQNEPSEDVETTTKSSRSTTKKPMKYDGYKYEQERERESHYEPERQREREPQQQRPAQAVEGEVPVNKESETTRNYQVAQYDPKALDSIPTWETGRMQYDENNQSVSYAPPEMTTMKSSATKPSRESTQSVPKKENLNRA